MSSSVTLTSAWASARTASSPPKPAPTTTTEGVFCPEFMGSPVEGPIAAPINAVQLSCETQAVLERLKLAGNHHQPQLSYGIRRVESLWTRLRTIHDRVAAIEAEWIFKYIESFAGGLIATVLDPAGCLQQRRGPKESLAVPPI